MADEEPGEGEKLASEANKIQQENSDNEPSVQNDTEDRIEENHGVKENEKENAAVEDKKENVETKVDVKYTFKATPTMQSLLTEYGLPEDKGKKAKKKPVEKTKPKEKEKKKKEKRKTWTEDREDTKTKQKEEHYSQVYKDVYKMRDYYYAHYMDLLKDKIEKQRQDIKQKSQDMENKILQKRQQEQAGNRQVQKRLERQDVKHDTFLKNLPKSRYYKMVAVQDKLRDKGELRTISDFEEFWTAVDRPGGLERYMAASNKAAEQTASEGHQTKSHVSLVSEPASLQPGQPVNPDLTTLRQLTEITETSDSRPATTRDWAVTQQAKHQHKQPASQKQMDPYTIARQAAIALDKQYPQLELPAMSCFTMKLGERPPDPEEVIKQMEARQRDRDRKLFVARLRKMYQLAVSNTASANRILDKHGDDFELALGGAHIHDIAKHAMDPSLYEEEKEQEDPKPWLRYSRSRGKMLPIEEVGEEQGPTVPSRSTSSKQSSRTGSAGSRGQSTKYRSSKSASRASRSAPQNALIPLTMDNLSQHTSTMEAQCISGFWNNYAKAGKSVFAKS